MGFVIPYIARWDLDKTYLQTEYATLRDLLRTAFERPDQKRTVPGAATLLREIAATGASVHILSGSPEQLRAKLEEKLRLDGARWDTFTLKPNLRNVLRLRFRAVRDQVGYKLPALLGARAALVSSKDAHVPFLREVLIGDDAESDALVYSLYADVVAGRVGARELEAILTRAAAYKDAIADAIRYARIVERGDAVERILIHLDSHSPPSDFAPYGSRLVPFYNYLQAAFVLEEDGRLPAAAVIRVAVDLVLDHRFDGEALGRSYLDLWRRGHLRGTGAGAIGRAFHAMAEVSPLPQAREIEKMCRRLDDVANSIDKGTMPNAPLDYVALLERHGRRRRAFE
ncbi:MAG TPA: hypothetical protein VK550_17550 [Polyangiaceae bacterium]|nr:hypothetical protein [Polyangiaceae bacterium]